jgi:hypothetical protein
MLKVSNAHCGGEAQRHMNFRSTVAVLAMAILLTAPSALAEWKGRGFYEPDTEFDTTQGWMFANPDVNPDAGIRQVYFSGYAGQSHGVHTAFNPNVATTGSQIMPYPTIVSAFLGVWKDCNSDGFIGLAESAGASMHVIQGSAPVARYDMSYPAALLSDDSVCPTGSPQVGSSAN